MRRATGLALLVVTLLCTLALTTVTSAESTEPRVFAPVQLGPTRDAQAELPYAPGRIRIKLTEQALSRSAFAAVELRRGATAGRAALGILSIDDVVTQNGLTRVWRQNDMPADEAFAVHEVLRAAERDQRDATSGYVFLRAFH